MKLKYYLRGLGMGIIFATLVLKVSSVIHNNNLSEEKIIKEAKKLGMVMPDETENTQGGLWVKNDVAETTESETIETEITSELETDSVSIENTESASSVEDTQAQENTTKDEKKDEGRPVTGENGQIYIIINVYPGDTARMVAERLYINELVDDAEAFRKYLGQTGQAGQLSVGEFMIPVDATYEEIFNVLMGR